MASMGEFADAIQAHIRDFLVEKHPQLDWHVEYNIAGTPIDLVGEASDHIYLIEVEWRRATLQTMLRKFSVT